MNPIGYKRVIHPRYKYKLTEPVYHELTTDSGEYTRLDHGWASIVDGTLIIPVGYMWNGASGPAVDTMNAARASVVHDALYQLIAAGKLPKKPWKKRADKELRALLLEGGMAWPRSQYWYLFVRVFGGARDKYRP